MEQIASLSSFIVVLIVVERALSMGAPKTTEMCETRQRDVAKLRIFFAVARLVSQCACKLLMSGAGLHPSTTIFG